MLKVLNLLLILSLLCSLNAQTVQAAQSSNKNGIQDSRTTELIDPNTLPQINSLIDTPYKLAAHYVPALMLRGLTNSDFPVKTGKKAHYERFIFLETDKVESPRSLLEKLYIDIEAKKSGLFSRDVKAFGTINGLYFDYLNQMHFRLSKKGTMVIRSTLAKNDFINVNIDTDGNAKTNLVSGKLLSRDLKYKTYWRTTEGNLGGYPYELYVGSIRDVDEIKTIRKTRQGLYKSQKIEMVKDRDAYMVKSEGKIGKYKISGIGEKVACQDGDKKAECYIFEEHYGPLVIKSNLKVY